MKTILSTIFFLKKLSRKQRAYLNLILGAILVVLIPLALASLRNPKSVSAAWPALSEAGGFNDTWSYVLLE